MIKRNLHSLNLLISAGVAGAMLAMSAPVLAMPAASATTISVATDDIDLASPKGVEKLNRRLASAIRLACGSAEFGGPTDFGTGEAARIQADCLAGAHAAALPQVRKLIANGNPRVAAN